jgi:hypothetical protein
VRSSVCRTSIPGSGGNRRGPGQAESWESRPVFLYGFDDLTVEQLELVRELSAQTQVTSPCPGRTAKP